MPDGKDLEATLRLMVEESGVVGKRAGSYDWPTVYQKIVNMGQPVTAAQVHEMAGTKHPNEARGWLMRKCVKTFAEAAELIKAGKVRDQFVRDPPYKAGTRASSVVYIPLAVLAERAKGKEGK